MIKFEVDQLRNRLTIRYSGKVAAQEVPVDQVRQLSLFRDDQLDHPPHGVFGRLFANGIQKHLFLRRIDRPLNQSRQPKIDNFFA